MLIVSCSTGNGKEPGLDAADDAESCSPGCEGSNLWPRAIINVVSPEGYEGKPTDLVAVHGVFFGEPQQALANGCPSDLPQSINCTYSLFGAPRDKSFELVVEGLSGQTLRTDVELAEFNRCGRAIAYITVLVEPDAITLSSVRYISPCNALQ
jgi:hypothetical protein